MENYVITIARGYGSGGRTIGKMLADELNIKAYDREIVRMASEESGINEALFGEADEKLKNPLMRYAKGVYKGRIITPDCEDFVSDKNLFNYEAKVVKELANKESCIIIGRCADYVLKDYKNVIRVFVHAPLESCVRTLSEMSSLNEKELEKRIQRIDKNRAAYYQHYTGREWNGAENYDLCLNSADLGFEKCVEIIKSYLHIRFQ